MEELVRKIKELKETEAGEMAREKIKRFQKQEQAKENVFSELCFCILTANFRADRCIEIQEELEEDFLRLDEQQLSSELKRLGHRFPNTRANYINESRECLGELTETLEKDDEKEIREWVVENVKGLGYKEASHFLRNMGYLNLAIIDFHILDILSSYDLIEKPRTLTRRRYLEIEKLLEEIAEKTGLHVGELDLYLWFMETGKMLK